MIVTELTKKIHDDYPKVYEELYDILYFIKHIEFDVKRSFGEDLGIEKLVSVFHGLLKDFFDEKGIAIEITKDYASEVEEWEYCLIWTRIDKSFQYGSIIENDFFLLKQQAKEAAILKACEILEEQL